jgi:cathepsin C
MSLETEPSQYKPWLPSGSMGYDKPVVPTWAQQLAESLNFLQLGWTASSYQMFHGKTPREMNRFAGVRRQRPHLKANSTHPSEVRPALSFLTVRSKTDLASFDWREHEGKNWLTPVVNQGDCGSCYTISTIHMLTARNRIHRRDLSQPSFSVSFPLYCAEYNQGCDGGYGFLQSKWSEDVGLVPEECAPFSQGGGSCQVASECNLGSKRHRAVNHHYVGGYYEASEPDSIRKELISGGPLVVSFEPNEDFMYYKSGVYRSGSRKIHQEWEQVDHAVLLVGFGRVVEKDQPYWTMQNSWGTDWGEIGFFRMARGIDESGCESIVLSADVVEETHNDVLDDFIKQVSA